MSALPARTRPPPQRADEYRLQSRAGVQEGEQRKSLKDAVRLSLDEARMVLPGLQAIFGFQLIVVFSERFERVLGPVEQDLHLCALCLVGVAMALIMTPAAYHRQTGPDVVSQRLLKVSTAMVSAALVPLMFGICIDVYLVAHVISGQLQVSVVLALALLLVFAALWFALPLWHRAHASPPHR